MAITKSIRNINMLNQRVQAVYRQVGQDNEGWQEKWVPGAFIWAGVIPIAHNQATAYEQEDLLKGRQAYTLYRLMMRRNYKNERRQSTIRRLMWKQNLIEVVCPWQEQVNGLWLESLGKIIEKGQNHDC